MQDCANQLSAGFHENLPAPHLEKCVFASCAASLVMIVFTSVQFHGGTGTARHARCVLTRHALSRHGTTRLDQHGHASLQRGMPRFGRRILNWPGTARSQLVRCDRHGTARGASAIQDLRSRILDSGSVLQDPEFRFLDPGSCVQEPGTGRAR